MKQLYNLRINRQGLQQIEEIVKSKTFNKFLMKMKYTFKVKNKISHQAMIHFFT